MAITWGVTERGFLKGEFLDLYEAKCSIQASSLADQRAIWLGCDHETVDEKGVACGSRMHVTRAMAEELGKLLIAFAVTGELPDWPNDEF